MPQIWQQFRDRITGLYIKKLFFDSSENSPYNIYANPFAATFKSIAPVQPPTNSPGPSRERSVSDSVTQGVPDLIECIICTETKHNTEFPAVGTTEKCQHDIDVCTGCMTESIDILFNSNIWDQINCPSCGLRLEPGDVNIFGSHETRERYPTSLICKE